MRITGLYIILVVVVIGISGCTNKATSKDNTVQNKTTQNEVASDLKSNQTENSVKEIDSPNVKNDTSDTITDITAWNHPVKYVFKNASVDISKVVFKNNKTYPIFYVNLSKNLDDSNKVYYKNLIKQVATANGYWDYEIIDQSKNIDIKVSCDRLNRSVKETTNNGDNTYFANITQSPVVNTDSEMVDYLTNNVSEVKSFMQALQSNQNGVKGVTYVEREPDPNSSNIYLKNYYGLYVGESHPDHNCLLYTSDAADE